MIKILEHNKAECIDNLGVRKDLSETGKNTIKN
jgi:hypothetical protein